MVDEKYTDPERGTFAKRLVFRTRLRDSAQAWYSGLQAETKEEWTSLVTVFKEEFKLQPKVAIDPNKYFNLIYNLKQGHKPIDKYVNEAEELYQLVPSNLKDYLGQLFVAGLSDDSKIDMVQLYLSTETQITFPAAKAAVIRAYSRIGRESPFDRSTVVEKKVTQDEVNSELLNFFKGLSAQASRIQPAYTPPPFQA